jgi:hypothetical protein
MTMTKFRLVGAALAIGAMQLMPVSAQVGEPAAAAARDPNFSIYAPYPRGGAVFDGSGAMAQTGPEDTLEPRMSVRSHRAHHMMKRH